MIAEAALFIMGLLTLAFGMTRLLVEEDNLDEGKREFIHTAKRYPDELDTIRLKLRLAYRSYWMAIWIMSTGGYLMAASIAMVVTGVA